MRSAKEKGKECVCIFSFSKSVESTGLSLMDMFEDSVDDRKVSGC